MIRLDELIPLLIFVSAVGLVFAAAGWEALRLLRERFARAERPKSRLRLLWRRGILGTAALGVACMAWGRFVEPFWPEVTRTPVPCRSLAPGARPLRIVHLSDLHCDPSPRIEDRLPDLVAAEKPDLVAFTGDAINSPEGLPHFRRTMQALARIAPTFAVKGNWDVWYFRSLDRFGGTGVEELDGRSFLLDVRGSPVRVAGVAYGNDEAAGASIRSAARGEVLLFLTHTPDLAESVAGRGVDLVLAGHTHGGQVALPFLGPVVTLTRAGRKHARGLSEMGGTPLYTSRGIGMEGGWAPRVRFLARPEVAVLDLVPAAR